MSTLIWVSSTIRRLVSTAWTSTAACEFSPFGTRIGTFAVLGQDTELECYRTRPGERVAKRRRAQSKVGASHRINQQETIKWFKNRFEGIVRGDRSG